ncbi:hypothetical protein U0070_026070 [Myodes glareolus]|uniref:RRM domain-containing protein n=1 Tax=Myodes glareolus TaxID=447135 RepID=A0AAW0HXS1_MYOGA
MNPLTKVKLINELNEREVQFGVAEKEYKDSAWIFLGGLPYELTEGDIICVFSQYGEIVNINLVRDKKTGKSKGFCFLSEKHNFNGIKIKGRTIRVDHVSNYRAPQESEDVDDVTRELQEKGCGANTPPCQTHKKAQKRQKGGKKEKKEKEKTESRELAEAPSRSLSSSSKTAKEKDDHTPKKHSSKNSEKAQKSDSREGKKNQPGSPDVRSSFHGRAEDPEWEPKKEKPKHEHKSSAGGREKKRAEIRTEGGAQMLIPAGMAGILKGGVTEAEVGVQISPIGIKSIGTPGSGSPSTPLTVGITEACANKILNFVV